MALNLQQFDFDFEADNRLLDVLHDKALWLNEHATKEFWLYVFKLVFFERKYIISSEQPPEGYGTQRSVDLVIKEGAQRNHPVILWREDKRGRATTNDIAEVESQGYSAGLEYVKSMTAKSNNQEVVWVMTGYGPNSRFWVYMDKGGADWLEPIWPRQPADGNRDTYIDLKGHELEYQWMFSWIKSNPFPTQELIDDYRDAETSILVDPTMHHQIQVVKVKEHEYIEGRLVQTNVIVQLPTQSYSSMIVWDNELRSCHHIVADDEVYWFWDFTMHT